MIYKRHRHRYEVNNLLRRRLEDEGLVCGGTSPDERLVELVELPDHPFYVASQFHPEFNSRPNRPEPLFREFIGAAARLAAERGPAIASTEALERDQAGDIGVRRSVCNPAGDRRREIVRLVRSFAELERGLARGRPRSGQIPSIVVRSAMTGHDLPGARRRAALR